MSRALSLERHAVSAVPSHALVPRRAPPLPGERHCARLAEGASRHSASSHRAAHQPGALRYAGSETLTAATRIGTTPGRRGALRQSAATRSKSGCCIGVSGSAV